MGLANNGSAASATGQPAPNQGGAGGAGNGAGMNLGGAGASGTGTNGFGPAPATLAPGQHIPYTGATDNPIQAPYGAPSTGTRQSFLDPSVTAPFYSASGVAGNLGTQSAANTQAAADFTRQMFGPNLTQSAQSYLHAGLGNASNLLEQGMNRQEDQFEGSPYNSALLQSQNNVMNTAGLNAMQTAGQMGMAQQQTAAGLSNQPFAQTMAANGVAPQMTQDLVNMANTQHQLPYQLGSSYYAQSPMLSPTIIPQSSSGGKL